MADPGDDFARAGAMGEVYRAHQSNRERGSGELFGLQPETRVARKRRKHLASISVRPETERHQR